MRRQIDPHAAIKVVSGRRSARSCDGLGHLREHLAVGIGLFLGILFDLCTAILEPVLIEAAWLAVSAEQEAESIANKRGPTLILSSGTFRVAANPFLVIVVGFCWSRK